MSSHEDANFLFNIKILFFNFGSLYIQPKQLKNNNHMNCILLFIKGFLNLCD